MEIYENGRKQKRGRAMTVINTHEEKCSKPIESTKKVPSNPTQILKILSKHSNSNV